MTILSIYTIGYLGGGVSYILEHEHLRRHLNATFYPKTIRAPSGATAYTNLTLTQSSLTIIPAPT